jgi:RNA polymerase sigma-B factor
MSPLDDHERVEQLLRQAETARDPDVADCLQQQAVLLTLDLADSVSRRYFGRGLDPDDLTQVGRLALVKAVRGYRIGQGNGFAAYAVPTIAGEIKRHFRDCGWAVRPPRRLQELRSDVAAAEERLRQSLQREPSALEVASEVGVDEGTVEEARQCGAAYHFLSLDAPCPGGLSVVESEACPWEEIDDIDARDALRQVLQDLSDREQLIVRLRFVDERTQSEIGAVLGVSQMQVSRVLSSILTRLRAGMAASAAA